MRLFTCMDFFEVAAVWRDILKPNLVWGERQVAAGERGYTCTSLKPAGVCAQYLRKKRPK
jgi:hypothetical protein